MRAYEAVKTLEEGKTPSAQGFNLVLSGRLQSIPGDGVIACVAPSADAPPDCIVSADFDRVWIETAGTGEIVGAETAGAAVENVTAAKNAVTELFSLDFTGEPATARQFNRNSPAVGCTADLSSLKEWDVAISLAWT